MPYTVYILLHVCSIYLVFQTTMPQRSLLVYFSSPVPPLPRAKREDVIDALLYFRFKDRITGHKRQKAEVPSDPESVDHEALPDNLSIICLMSPIQAVTQIRHHHQVLVPVPVPLPMGAAVQMSLILTGKKDHCHLA